MNKYNPNIHNRRSIRLKGYDYSQPGLYFITICCQDRICRFGKIENGKMILNDAGVMVEKEWLNLKNRFPNIELHEFVVMPNHFHAILEITNGLSVGGPLVVPPMGQGQALPQRKTVGDIVGAFQSIITVKYIQGVKNLGWEPFNKKLLQRNYYEHIIRNQQAYINISNYIINNPANWNEDKRNRL